MESEFAGFTFQKQEFIGILLSKSVLILTVTYIFVILQDGNSFRL